MSTLQSYESHLYSLPLTEFAEPLTFKEHKLYTGASKEAILLQSTWE